MVKGRKRNKKKIKINSALRNIIIIMILLLVILTSISFYSFSKKETPVTNNYKYFKGSLYTLNASANMLDYLSNGENYILSPLNANTALAILYNGTDNTSYKQINKYFGNDVKQVNEYMLNVAKTSTVENDTHNENFEKCAKQLIEKNYHKISAKEIARLSQKEREALILLVTKADLYYNQHITRMKNKDIEKYKLSDKERKYTGYYIKELIDKVIIKYETAQIENSIIDYHEMYYDSNRKYKINKNYTSILKEYNCELTKVDYKSKETKKIINDKLDKIISNDTKRAVYDSDLEEGELIFINNLSFNYEWQDNYPTEDIKDEEFTNYQDEHFMVEMMHSEEKYYIENEYATGFLKPFKNNKYYFVGILPKEKGTKEASALDLDGLLATKKETTVYVGLPKFTIESNTDLASLYNNYSIKDIFNKRGNFHQMTELDTYVSKMYQKEYLNIGEYGTVNSNTKTANLSTRTFDNTNYKVILNRPFVFLIINAETNEVLLIGYYNNPII